jgi:hypothetical protein
MIGPIFIIFRFFLSLPLFEEIIQYSIILSTQQDINQLENLIPSRKSNKRSCGP